MDMMEFVAGAFFGMIWGVIITYAAFWAVMKIVEMEVRKRKNHDGRDLHTEKGGNNQ